jgi:hypothetical protein
LRKHLIWVLALAVAVAAVGVTSVAVGANSQTIKGTIAPIKQKKKAFGKASVTVLTKTNDTDGTVSPATRAQIFFDDDIKFDTRGVVKCPKSKVDGNKTTAAAKNACPFSVVGSGNASIAVAGNPDAVALAKVTAFNGVPKGGKPVILLHSYSAATGLAPVLDGVLKNTSGDFGKILDVAIPPLPFGSAITSFETKVQRSTRFEGKTINFVSARCKDGNRKWNYKGKFTYDGSPSKTATSAQTCKVKP